MNIYVAITCTCGNDIVSELTPQYTETTCECGAVVRLRQAQKPSRIFKPGMTLREQHEVVRRMLGG